MPVPARSTSMCQVSFSEPARLRRVRDRKVAVAGVSRVGTDETGAFAGAGSAAAFAKRDRVGALPAGNPEFQPFSLFRNDEVRIVLAIVAALAAILLRHRGHHAPPQRAALGH